MYCFTTESGASPVVLTKYEFVHKVGNFRFNPGNSWRKKTRRTAFHQLHQAMNAKLGVYIHEKMHMSRHHFECFDLCLVLFTDLTNDLFEPLINGRHQHLSPLVRTPDHLIMAGIEHISVAFVASFIHRCSLQHRASYVKTFVPIPRAI
jgi:hypothetical protein